MKAAQSCPTVCDTMGYTVHGILQARILEWVAIPFSRGSSQSRYLPNLGIKPGSPALQVDSLPDKPQGKPKDRLYPWVRKISWRRAGPITREQTQKLIAECLMPGAMGMGLSRIQGLIIC